MNILVLGGGQQGRVIAGDLARSLGSARVTVADIREPRLAAHSNLRWLAADLSDPAALARLVHAHDLVVGALPSRFGWNVMQAAIEAKLSMSSVGPTARASYVSSPPRATERNTSAMRNMWWDRMR